MAIDNRKWTSAEDETVPMLSGAYAPVALAHYRLRAAAHRIATDCERVLGELNGTTHQSWRDAVGSALLAAQHLRSLIVRIRASKTGADAHAALVVLEAASATPARRSWTRC